MSQPTDNKQLRVYDDVGNFKRFSVDEVIAKGYNKWQGWHCSAGARNLYIDYDGMFGEQIVLVATSMDKYTSSV